MTGVAAVIGVAAAGWVRAQVFLHSVPPGQPWRTACPDCASTLITSRHAWAWLPRARCPWCGHRVGPAPGSVELVLVVVLSLLAWAVTDPLALLAAVVVAVAATALACIDLAVCRLPDRLTLPTFVAAALLLVAGAFVHGRASNGLAALTAAAASSTVYLVLALTGGGAGDAKLARGTGLLLGWYGWPALVAGTAGALTLTAVCGGVLRLSGQLPRGGQVPHGPAILAAALAVLLAATHHPPA